MIPPEDEKAVAQVKTISLLMKPLKAYCYSLHKVGKDGVITVEEGVGLEMEVS